MLLSSSTLAKETLVEAKVRVRKEAGFIKNSLNKMMAETMAETTL